jgi:hypothetical protein
MKMSGKRNFQIAKELRISDSAVCQHLNRVKDLGNMKANGEIEDPINNHRARLINRLKKGEKVIDYTLRPKTFKKNHQHLAIANNTTIAMYKGLGVLVDKTEVSGQVDLLAQRRDDMRARLDACRQFGLNPANELKAVGAEVVEVDDSPINVPRADSPKPEAQPIKAETVVNQPTIKPQVALESASKPADKPQAQLPRQTLSRSRW